MIRLDVFAKRGSPPYPLTPVPPVRGGPGE